MSRNHIEAHRKARNLSLAEVGRALGVDRATVLRWERGDIPIEQLKRVARFFQVPATDLDPELGIILAAEETANVV